MFGAVGLGCVFDEGEAVVFAEFLRVSVMRAGWPKMWTGMTAFVASVMAASTFSGSRLKSNGSTSTKTGVAPHARMLVAVAMKLNGVVMTSSPGPTPCACSATMSAAVPLFTPIACFAPDVARERRFEGFGARPLGEVSAVEHFHDGALFGFADERLRHGDELAFDGGHFGRLCKRSAKSRGRAAGVVLARIAFERIKVVSFALLRPSPLANTQISVVIPAGDCHDESRSRADSCSRLDAPSVKDDAKMLARYATLGAAAGGLGGLLVGGIGGRIAMFVLRLTSPDSIRGVESDDGFEMGRFDISSTIDLFVVTTILGIVGGLIVVVGRPFFPRKLAPFGWALAAGAIVGATIVQDDGVDFTLLEPVELAVAMFIAIPAIGAYVIAEIVYRAEPWWWKDRKRTFALGAFGLPIVIGFPLAIFARSRLGRLAGGAANPGRARPGTVPGRYGCWRWLFSRY